MDLPWGSYPAPLSGRHPGTPTLNPDPEALLHLASGALGQAGVQPSIAHLGMEHHEQLPLATAHPPPDLVSLPHN